MLQSYALFYFKQRDFDIFLMFDENSKRAGLFTTLLNEEFNRHPPAKKQPLAPATKHLQTPKTRPCQAKNIA